MQADTRTRMLTASTELFRDRGYDGTGFREVVSRADAARGAIYHHFPNGKVQLATEVVAQTGARIAEIIAVEYGQCDPHEALQRLCVIAERIVFDGDLKPGCPVAAVALAGDDPDGLLRGAAAEVFDLWRSMLARFVTEAGASPPDAARFATLAVSAIEGSLLLCRAADNPAPLREVAVALGQYLDLILPPRSARPTH